MHNDHLPTDIDECSVAAENDTDLCTSPMFCSNVQGGFECLCPGGTEQAGGTCVSIGEHLLYTACMVYIVTRLECKVSEYTL